MTPALRRTSRKVARHLVGSRLTRRFLWARWAVTRASTAAGGRRVYRRTNVEWDLAGHARLVHSDISGPGPDEVLVRTIASAVSPGTERAGFRGETATAKFPALPGYSLAGEVVARGRRVKGIDLGELVATQAPHASLAVRPKDMVFPIGPNTNPIHASLLYPAMIALHGLWRGEFRTGERIAVYGRGTIGQLCVLMARALGAGEVVSIARSRHRLNDSIIAASDQIVATGDADSLPSAPLDLVIEASGEPAAIADAVLNTRSGGRVVLLGSPRRSIRFDFAAAAEKRVDLIGAHISTLPRRPRSEGNDYRTAADTFLRLLDEGAIRLGPLIGQEIDPWEAGWFYRHLSKGTFTQPVAVFRWDLLASGDRGGRIGFFAAPNAELVRGMSFRQIPIAARATSLQ